MTRRALGTLMVVSIARRYLPRSGLLILGSSRAMQET